MHFDDCVDARGLACPMPLLKAKLALNQLAAGQVLKVVATDAGAQRDIPAFARLSGHELLSAEQTPEQQFIFYLRKKQDA